MISGGNQQISPCFLQDLLSEVLYHQMQRSYEGVKVRGWCEGVTVGRRVAPGGGTTTHLLACFVSQE